MTVSRSTPLTLDDWLLAMVSADPADYRMVAVRGIAGLIGARIRCTVHGQTFTWATLQRHMTDTETAWREAHPEDGPHAALHRPGDLVEEVIAEPPRWTVTTCRSCGARIVWALTSSGKRMPVDAAPHPTGNITLAPAESSVDAPHALVLHHEYEQDQVPPERRHLSHFATCSHADKHRRRR